jgi:hypothetical protein
MPKMHSHEHILRQRMADYARKKADHAPALKGYLDQAVGCKLFLVDGNILWDETLSEFGLSLVSQKLFRMPFERTCIEIIDSALIQSGSVRKFLWCHQITGRGIDMNGATVERGEDDVQLFVYDGHETPDGRYAVTTAIFSFDMSSDVSTEFDFVRQTIALDKPLTEKECLDAHDTIQGVLFSFVPLIESKSTVITEKKAPEQLNKARAKKGKVPLQAVRYVEVPSLHDASKSGTGGTHASPRMHWRRGHLRRWKDGVIPVSPCVVGAAESGVVQQIYRARVKPL